MFIDYVALMLVNMTAGLVILAGYILWGLDRDGPRPWAIGFAIPGFIAMVTGLHMSFTWPLPGPYNITHGELSVLFGTIYLALAVAVGLRWNLMPVAAYAFFAGLASVVVGIGVYHHKLTLAPAFSAAGYILTGLAGVFSAPVLVFKNVKAIQWLAALVLLAAAGIWGLTGYGAYWDHLNSMKAWKPATMIQTR